MKKIGLIVLACGFIANVFAANVSESNLIRIGASPVPHAEILKFVKPILAKQGITLQITEYSDYVLPNMAVAQKQLDANFFQHQPYLDKFNKDRKTDLVSLVKVHLEPMGAYTNKISKELEVFAKTKKVTDIPLKVKIGVPNDPSNEERALKILQTAGIIKLKADANYPTKKDIIENPRNVEIIELEPAIMPRALNGKQVVLALINTNYALAAKLNPTQDTVLIEDSKSSPFANLVAVRRDEVGSPKMKKLSEILNSPEVKKYIADKYRGEIMAAF